MVDVLDKERQGLDPKLKEIVDEADRNFIYCRTCSNVIARHFDRIEVAGSHDHQFVNPFGIRFHIGCFAQALGCTISGERVAADTWFPGFQWQIASCAECRAHLGWYFDRADEYFYGLILDRIQND
jgi:hypothetical protein